MSYMLVASEVLGFIGDKRAADKQQHAIDAENDKARQELKAKKDAWTEIYGDLEQNLADYYTNLTPDILEATGLQDEAESFAKAKKHYTTLIAQRGLGGSGLEADFLAKQEIGSAERRAEIRATAEETVREKQRSFLQGGAQEKRDSAKRGEFISDTAAQQRLQIANQRAQAEQQSAQQLIEAGAKEFGRQPITIDQTPEEFQASQDFDVGHNVGFEPFE